jgi:hypothetical protein
VTPVSSWSVFKAYRPANASLAISPKTTSEYLAKPGYQIRVQTRNLEANRKISGPSVTGRIIHRTILPTDPESLASSPPRRHLLGTGSFSTHVARTQTEETICSGECGHTAVSLEEPGEKSTHECRRRRRPTQARLQKYNTNLGIASLWP